jgi:hypothetical protein
MTTEGNSTKNRLSKAFWDKTMSVTIRGVAVILERRRQICVDDVRSTYNLAAFIKANTQNLD